MPLNLSGLTTKDFPKPFTKNHEKFYIKTEKAPTFSYKKKGIKGGNNKTFIVKLNDDGKKYLYRESLFSDNPINEKDMYLETILAIKMNLLNISPKMYGYGYDPIRKKYWSLHELFDCNLGTFVKKFSNCDQAMKNIEHQLIKLFKKLNKTSFCYDLHPMNVVVKLINKKKFSLKLIDFDAKYCTLKPPSALSSLESLYATCIVFSNNFSNKTCKNHIYFQNFLKKNYDRVNIKKVILYLERLRANDPSKKFSCKSILLHWRQQGQASVKRILNEIMFGKIKHGIITKSKSKKFKRFRPQTTRLRSKSRLKSRSR